jgi:competence protein ComGC
MKPKTNVLMNQYPKMVQEFAKENFTLKALCGVLLAIVFVCLAVVAYLVKQGPEVVALDASGAVVKVESQVTDLQIESAAKDYLAYRYNWNPNSITGQLKKATFFVHPSLVSAFERSMVEVQKFVRDKKVVQRAYPKAISVDLKKKVISVTADRFTEFDGLKAATELKVTLSFLIDDRTVVNPWGVYITKETEEGAR